MSHAKAQALSGSGSTPYLKLAGISHDLVRAKRIADAPDPGVARHEQAQAAELARHTVSPRSAARRQQPKTSP